MVKFAPMNLAQPLYLGRFDCIFCMNVLIYFGEELRSKLIQRFYETLEPGGYLFLGHAESVANAPVRFHQTFLNGARLLQKPMQNQACREQAAGGAQ
jgi:chemotaxis protein methyltransferase CheR